jgi:hypothetical protein
MMKKILFVCFIIAINFATVLSQGVKPVNGSGVPNDPYQIENLENLVWVSDNASEWNKHFIQTSDIDATESANLNNGQGFSPIGTYIEINDDTAFTGVYNGDNYSITNLVIKRPNTSNFQALFGCIRDGTVINLRMDDAQITSHNYTGILAGYIHGSSSVINCVISGVINATGQNIGGLAGGAGGGVEKILIDSCFTNVTIAATGTGTAVKEHVGGFIGSFHEGTIMRSGTKANISAGGYAKVGGMIGICGGAIIKSGSSTGILDGTQMIGGFIGYGSTSEIDSCYANVTVVSTDNTCGGFAGGLISCGVKNSYSLKNVTLNGSTAVGGFVGFTSFSKYEQSFSHANVESTGTYAGGFIGHAGQETSISNCYARGDVHSTNDYAGGFIGIANNIPVLKNCYSTGKVTGTGIKGGFAGFNHYTPATDCFWDMESSENITSAGQFSGDIPQYLTGKSTQKMKNVSTFTNIDEGGLSAPWDFENNPFNDTSNVDIWQINPEINNGYPYFTAVFPPEIFSSAVFPYLYEDAEKTQLVAYPNPWISSQKSLNLILKSHQFETGNFTASIIDVYGRIHLTKKLLIPADLICSEEILVSIDFKSKQLLSGVYFIELMKHKKIIGRTRILVIN